MLDYCGLGVMVNGASFDTQLCFILKALNLNYAKFSILSTSFGGNG